MDVHSHIWWLVFTFLCPSDLVRAGISNHAWWKVIFGKQSTKFLKRKLRKCQDLDLSNTGTLYLRIPLKVFKGILHLDLDNTGITSNHLVQIAKRSEEMLYLSVANCSQLNEDFLFQCKRYFNELSFLDISFNPYFTIMGLACACSYSEIRQIQVHGMKLSPKECSFLLATFSSITSGECRIETADGEYPVELYDTFREDFEDLEL